MFRKIITHPPGLRFFLSHDQSVFHAILSITVFVSTFLFLFLLINTRVLGQTEDSSQVFLAKCYREFLKAKKTGTDKDGRIRLGFLGDPSLAKSQCSQKSFDPKELKPFREVTTISYQIGRDVGIVDFISKDTEIKTLILQNQDRVLIDFDNFKAPLQFLEQRQARFFSKNYSGNPALITSIGEGGFIQFRFLSKARNVQLAFEGEGYHDLKELVVLETLSKKPNESTPSCEIQLLGTNQKLELKTGTRFFVDPTAIRSGGTGFHFDPSSGSLAAVSAVTPGCTVELHFDQEGTNKLYGTGIFKWAEDIAFIKIDANQPPVSSKKKP